MREIGGFLELENNRGHEFHENSIALNSGRNCLRFLLRAREIRRIWLPKLLCSAISETCEEENVEIEYYPVNGQLKPILTSVPGNFIDLVIDGHYVKPVMQVRVNGWKVATIERNM